MKAAAKTDEYSKLPNSIKQSIATTYSTALAHRRALIDAWLIGADEQESEDRKLADIIKTASEALASCIGQVFPDGAVKPFEGVEDLQPLAALRLGMAPCLSSVHPESNAEWTVDSVNEHKDKIAAAFLQAKSVINCLASSMTDLRDAIARRQRTQQADEKRKKADAERVEKLKAKGEGKGKGMRVTPTLIENE